MKKIYLQSILILLFFTANIFADNGNKYPEGFKPKTNSGLSFTENNGQVHDQNNNARPDVLFSGTDGKLVFHLKNNGISYQLDRVDSWKEEIDPKTKEKTKRIDQSTIYRLDINWLNANTNSGITKGTALEGVNNYYLEHCGNGALNVRSYEDITYKNIYTGIDLKWYQKDGHLKYDYLVEAGSDYKQIQLEFKGAQKISLNSKGELVLKTPLGDIIEQAPLVIQNGKELKSKWIIKTVGELSRTISFEIENINPNQSFIIDPAVRVWGTYYGGAGDDNGPFTATDASGNVYMAGSTNSGTGTVIATAGSHQTNFAGVSDAFLVKFNGAGVRQWGTYYGGTGNDFGYSCATDASGNVYMAGQTFSGTGSVIATAGSHQSAFGGGGVNDAFLVKFNSAGVRQWGTYYGGIGAEIGRSCAADASGNVYMAGYAAFSSGTVIATAGSHQSAFGGGSDDAFLVKFNSAGVRQWGTYYGGIGAEIGQSCATDASGNVYMAGYTASNTGTVIATAGSHQSAFGGGTYDAYLVQFSSSGIRQWSTYYGGTGAQIGQSCATDASGNVYMAGYTASNTGTVIATAGSHQSAFGGGSDDAFLVKFNSAGVRQWGTYYGGAGVDLGQSCTTDASGNVYMAGHTASGTGTVIATASSHQSAFGGGVNDAFLVHFNSVGVRQLGTYYGGASDDFGYSCAIDASGNVYMSGNTYSGTGTVIATAGSHQSAFGGGGVSDAFLVKFGPCALAPSQPGTINGLTSICTGAGSSSYSIATVAGATSYTWSLPGGWSGSSSTNTISATPGTSGIFSVTASNACGTSPQQTLSVSVNATPTITVNSGSICSGNSFTIIPGGASTYTIQGGSSVVSPVSNTSYTVTGTSTAGCVSANSATSNVTVNGLPTITVNSGSICSGQSFTIVPGGASTYTIQGGSAVVSPLSNTSYTVTGTSTAGCVSATSATSNVTVNGLPTITVNSGSICSGQSFTMVPGGASTYTIQGGSSVVSPLSNTSYTVTGTSTAGCVSASSATSNVTVNGLPTITVNSGSICSGQSFTMVPGGASTYTIQGGSAVVSPLSNTSYTVTGTSTAGCVSANSATSNVTVNSTPTISVAGGAICPGGSFTFNPSGAATYTYSGGQVVSPGITTTYSITGTSTAGCVSQVAVATITVASNLTVSISGTNTICSGQPINLTAGGATTYTWNTGATTTTIAPTPTANITYSVIGASGSCSNTANISVTVNPLPTITANTTNTLICTGQSATLTASGATSYTWSPGGSGTSIVVSPTVNATYTITGTNASGCTNTSTFTQLVDPCLGISSIALTKEEIIIYPNPTTDEVYVTGLKENTLIEIYNTLGQKVAFTPLSLGEGLGVRLNDQPNGIYFIRIGSVTKKIIKQ